MSASIVNRYRYPFLFLTIIVFVAVWWVVAKIVNDPYALAGPVSTAKAYYQLFAQSSLRNLFITSIESTLLSIFLGFVLAVAIGIPVGIFMGRYLVVDYLVDSWINIWYSIPAIAFVPLVMNWAGLTSISALIVSFLIAVFSIIINVYTGVKNVSASLVEPAIAFGISKRALYTKVILPASTPNIMVGLRLGITRAIEGVIVAEMVFSVVGLGGMIFDTADKLEMSLTIALVIVISLISIALNYLMKYLDHKVVFWKESSALKRG